MLYQYAVFPALKASGWLQNRTQSLLKGEPYKRDDEYAHTLALTGIQAMQRVPGLIELLEFITKATSESKPRTVFGLTFPAPIGLAAGLDKEGTCLPFCQAAGFGFAEVGTVLPYFQEGNPRPRLFRLDKEEALINRMGFNSPGMVVVRENLTRTKHRVHIPIIGSLGAMRETVAEEPENAKLEYISVARDLIGLVAALIANVSSPNTPGLRGLQGRAYIEDLLTSLVRAIALYAEYLKVPIPPLLVKVAPDLTLEELNAVIGAVLATGTDGLIIGNTTVTRPESSSQPLYAEAGGLSGSEWLFDNGLMLGKYARHVAPQLPLVLVGGINTSEKAARALGVADLIEVLTGFVYQGPKLIRAIRRECARVPLYEVLGTKTA